MAGMIAPGFIRATHPDHGEAVVFVPGELLPEWVAEALSAGRGEYDAKADVMVVGDSAPKRKGRSSATD